jgi:hypothetical protein
MGGCLSSDSGPAVPNIVLNLDATPNSDQDRRIIDSLAKHLEKTDTLLSALQGYKGCEKYIRTVCYVILHESVEMWTPTDASAKRFSGNPGSR